MSDTDFPRGACECRKGCACEQEAGPAAYEVIRAGKRLKVCTRCTLSGDTERKTLIQPNDPVAAFEEHDPDGFSVLVIGEAIDRRRSAS